MNYFRTRLYDPSQSALVSKQAVSAGCCLLLATVPPGQGYQRLCDISSSKQPKLKAISGVQALTRKAWPLELAWSHLPYPPWDLS